MILHRWIDRIEGFGYLLPSALTGYLFFKGLNPALPGFSCPLRALTGIPCPTCFLTRATSCALIGDLSGSVRWHAFGPIAAAGLILWATLSIRQHRLIPKTLKAWPFGVMTIALMTYWILRLIASLWIQQPGILQFPMPMNG
ncbi:MAG: hypothetical protein CL862_09165 [Cyanobium sp. NAT70]|nr:hypothetical protein [Cyanobium sp. NAT70]